MYSTGLRMRVLELIVREWFKICFSFCSIESNATTARQLVIVAVRWEIPLVSGRAEEANSVYSTIGASGYLSCYVFTF